MARPQPGIFAQGTRSHYHLEFDLRPGATDDAIVRRAARPARAAGHRRRFEHRRRLRPRRCGDACARRRPRRRWRRLRGHRGRRPTRAGDPARHLGVDPRHRRRRRARRRARRSSPCSRRWPTLAAEQPCFVYRDSRDLTGFIDGTENPPVEEALDVALVPDGAAGRGRRVRARAEVGARPRRVPRAVVEPSRRAPSGAPSPTASSSTTSPPPRTSPAS